MTGKKETDIAWRHTSVVVRADIFSKAHEQGIDISDLCNKALADLLGVDYHQQKLDNVPVTRPVIIAQNGPHTEEKARPPAVHSSGHSPVINADDPAASLTVRSVKRQPRALSPKKTMEHVTIPQTKKEVPALVQAANAVPEGKTQKPTTGKTKKNEGLKKFVAAKITRSDAVDAVVSKDEMYQAFTRFSTEHKYTPVPDRKAFTLALKNKFAFFDKTINGIPSWVNVRLH